MIVVVPVETLVATPVALIVATDGELELHVTNAVRSCVPPLVYVPVAKYAIEEPVTTTAFAGVMAMDVNCDEGTVIVALPQVDPAQALTVTLPVARAYTEPELVESLVTVATAESDELQETDASV